MFSIMMKRDWLEFVQGLLQFARINFFYTVYENDVEKLSLLGILEEMLFLEKEGKVLCETDNLFFFIT